MSFIWFPYANEIVAFMGTKLFLIPLAIAVYIAFAGWFVVRDQEKRSVFYELEKYQLMAFGWVLLPWGLLYWLIAQKKPDDNLQTEYSMAAMGVLVLAFIQVPLALAQAYHPEQATHMVCHEEVIKK